MSFVKIQSIVEGDIVVGLVNADFVFNYIVNIENIDGVGYELTLIRENIIRTVIWNDKTYLFVIKRAK